MTLVAIILWNCNWCFAQPSSSIADIPLPTVNNGIYVHRPDIVTKLISIGSDGLILECKTENPLQLWRERYAASGSRMQLTAVLRPIVVSMEPLEVQWAESKVGDNIATLSPTIDAPQVDPRHPQPRKTLQQHSRPAIYAENKFGTSNIGPTTVDSRWSNFGEYLQRLIEAVQIEWDRILNSGGSYPPSGTVSIKFTLDSKGRISAILDHQTTGTDTRGTTACMGAITNRAPYGAWTPEMIAVLGNSQDMTFTFYYQP